MDFQYCDRCGDVTGANHAAGGSELLCAKCAGRPASTAAPRSGLHLLEDPGFSSPMSKSGDVSAQDLELFSNDTLVMRRDRPKSTKLKLVDARDGGSTAERKPGSAALGSTQPIRAPVGGAGGTADRWRVDCLLCGGSLSVRPVPKRSKLRCPRCHQIMVLDPSGQVSAAGSVAEPRPARPPSSAVPMPPQAAAPPKPAAKPKSAARPKSTAPKRPPTPPVSVTVRTGAPPPMPAAAAPAARPAPPRGASPGSAVQAKRPPPAILGSEFDFGTPLPAPGSTAQRRSGGGSGGSVAIASPPTAPVAGGAGIPFAISDDHGLPPPSEGMGIASALLGAERHSPAPVVAPARIPMRSGKPVSTVSSFGSLFWITLALLPSLCGFLAVHEVSGWFGTGLLHGLGETVGENAVRLLDWSSVQLDRLLR